ARARGYCEDQTIARTNPNGDGAMSVKTRRDFLKTTAAAAVAAGIAAREVDASEDLEPIPQAQPRAPLADGDVVKVAIIGTGGMGTGHAQGFARNARDGQPVRIEALCDLCDPRAISAKARVDKLQN